MIWESRQRRADSQVKGEPLKILVYGAGNIGSLYAAKRKEAGNDVKILARSTRPQEIDEHGLPVQDYSTNPGESADIPEV